jgi:CheY-like chemotaxis protein
MPELVLIIDDDAALAQLTQLWVESAGYRALAAHDGASGLAAARVVKPDVVLLDIAMPGLNGYEVSRHLKADGLLAHVPVIFLSANVHETARREAHAAGAAHFLSKPYAGAELLVAIALALAGDAGVRREGVKQCS